jgi:hypothetical protein
MLTCGEPDRQSKPRFGEVVGGEMGANAPATFPAGEFCVFVWAKGYSFSCHPSNQRPSACHHDALDYLLILSPKKPAAQAAPIHSHAARAILLILSILSPKKTAAQAAPIHPHAAKAILLILSILSPKKTRRASGHPFPRPKGNPVNPVNPVSKKKTAAQAALSTPTPQGQSC